MNILYILLYFVPMILCLYFTGLDYRDARNGSKTIVCGEIVLGVLVAFIPIINLLLSVGYLSTVIQDKMDSIVDPFLEIFNKPIPVKERKGTLE